ncbi:MAG: sensor histidine kinase [Egibacteraceae bacterium]
MDPQGLGQDVELPGNPVDLHRPDAEHDRVRARSLRAVPAAVVILSAYTAASWLLPELRATWFSPEARVVIEVLGLCVALFAVLALLLPDDGDEIITRNAFIASLMTLGVSNVVFGVGPLLTGFAGAFGGVYSFYPWLAARYLAGGLFIAASLRRPRVPLRWYLVFVVTALVVVDAVLFTVRDHLPSPLVTLDYSPGGVVVPMTRPAQDLAIAYLPAVLFGVGAWLAARAYRRGAAPLYVWVSAALLVQGAAKVHESFYPSVLGPVITSADALRLIFLALLLVGALQKVRQVVIDRGAAVRALDGDLRARDRLLAGMQDFTEREQSFRSLVVHELGTPIATLRTFGHVLADLDGESGTTEPRRVAARGVEAESRRLQELVDRMEELRDLEFADFHCELKPIRLRPLVDDAATYTRGLPGGHPAVVDSECGDVWVLADSVRLGQALRNMLANAARYSPERSRVTIDCRVAAEGRIDVAVVDRGPGIPPQERERVVERFQRGSAGAGQQGTGLGLYVASRVAQAHEGRLLIDEAPGPGGTRVVIQLRQADPVASTED